jgi:hypothetical protein
MLQPKSYPALAGKALMLDAEPFLTLVEDDNPWVEGLFFVTCVGTLAGVAGLVGSLLLAASLPDAAAVRETVIQGVQHLLPWVAGSPLGAADALAVETALRANWPWAAGMLGYGAGLARLFGVLLTPVGLVLQWLFLGLIAHVAARQLGGIGRLGQTLGATALAAAPHLLAVLTAIPLVTVPGLLLAVWGLLIAYRGVEVAHDLPWSRAALAVLAAPALFLLLVASAAALIGLLVGLGGVSWA